MRLIGLQSHLPLLTHWPSIDRRTLRADLWAGLTGAVIVLPQGVAFALLAGLPPEYGLYTAIVPAIVAALCGSSWHLVSGPTTAISIVVFSALSVLAPAGSEKFVQLAITAAALTGAIQLMLGLARLGGLAKFVSHTVMAGFTTGAAILIITSQLTHVFGVPTPPGGSFAHKWLTWFQGLGETNLYVLAVALTTLLVALIIAHWRPRFPAMLIAMAAGTSLSIALNGPAHGVPLLGVLPQQLPSFSPPDLSFATLKQLAPSALAIALLGLVEASSIARAIAARSGQHLDGNREFIGQGLSNIVGSFFSCYPASGSFTRSGVNYTVGARTPIAAIFAALILILIVLLAAPLAAYLPIPALAGILMLVGWNLIDFRRIYHVLRTSTAETAVLLTTLFAALLLELEFAIYTGVLLSLVLYLNRTSKPNVVTLAPDVESEHRRLVNIERTPLSECPQLKILRIDGSLFFGAADYLDEQLRALAAQSPEQRHLLVVCIGINFIDMAGCDLLAREGDRRRAKGGSLSLVGLKTGARQTLERSGALKHVHQVFASKHEAIATLYEIFDNEICVNCTRRVFNECARTPRPADAAEKPDSDRLASDTAINQVPNRVA